MIINSRFREGKALNGRTLQLFTCSFHFYQRCYQQKKKKPKIIVCNCKNSISFFHLTSLKHLTGVKECALFQTFSSSGVPKCESFKLRTGDHHKDNKSVLRRPQKNEKLQPNPLNSTGAADTQPPLADLTPVGSGRVRIPIK